MKSQLQLSPKIAKLQTEVTTLEKGLGKVIIEHDEIVNALKPTQ